MKKLAYLLALMSGLALAAGSTVNPTIPVANSPLQSAPIRGNFAATASDINSLIQINAGTTAPATPLLGQQWLNTTATPYVWNVFDGAVWDILGTLNASTNTFQAGSVPWSGVTGTPTTLSGYGITNGVSSVGVTMPSAFSCTGSPVTSSGTVACVFAAQSQAYFLASPAGATGTPLMRQIAATDIPTLNQNTTGNAATVTTNANLTGDVTSVGNATTIAPTGVTAGTYAQVTVNAKGQATAGVALNTVPFGGTGVGSISGIVKGAGTGPFVTATSGTDYVAPGGAGGTPSSINLANGTGLPISTGVSGLGTGVATGLGNAVTGSGSPVLATSPSISGPTITGSFAATGLVTLADLATQTTNTVLGNATNATASPTALTMTSCSTAGSAVTWTTNTGFGCNTSIAAASAGSVTVGTTTVGSGTTAYLLYNNGGTLGNEAASSVPFTTGTLSLAGNLATTGAFNWGFTVPGAYTYTLPGATTTLDGLGVAQTFTAAKTFTNSDLLLLGSSTGATTFTSANGSATNYTLTFPAATDTICTIAATQTLTGKSIAASEVNSGTLAAAQMPALTGDVTTSAGAVATTLATVNGNVGSYTNANITVNAKGLITAAANGSAGGASVVNGYIGGFGLSNDGTAPSSVIDVAAGYAADSTNAVMITGTAFTKQVSGASCTSSSNAFVAGTGNCGLFGTAVANNTWYHVFAVMVSGSYDVYLDTSATAANKPAGTTAFRYVGSIRTTGTGAIMTFFQYGQKFYWGTSVTDLATGAASSITATTLTTPLGFVTYPIVIFSLNGTTIKGDTAFLYPGFSAGPYDVSLYVEAASTNAVANVATTTNTSSQVSYKVTSATGTGNILTVGYINPHVAPNF